MPDQRVAPKVDIGHVIGSHIASVIYDPKNMVFLEKAVDKWLTEQEDRSPEQKKVVMDSLMRGRQAMEGIYSRVHQTY